MTMNRFTAALAVAVSLCAAGTAQAGPASDAFGRCLVLSSTGQDRVVLVRWMFGMISAHPEVRALTTVTPEQRAAMDRAMVDVLQRLVLNDCRKEVVAAIRDEGEAALRSSFEVLGKTAMTDLMSEPAVAGQLDNLSLYVDPQRWAALMEEAQRK